MNGPNDIPLIMRTIVASIQNFLMENDAHITLPSVNIFDSVRIMNM